MAPGVIDRKSIEAIGKAAEYSPQVEATLLAALEHEDKDVRSQACWSLGRLGAHSKPHVPKLIAALGDDTWEVRHNAGWALRAIKDGVGPQVIAALEHENPWTRLEAARVLTEVDPSQHDRAAEMFIEGLGADDEKIRVVAAQGLVSLGAAAKAAVPQLREAVKDDNEHVRKTSITALGLIGEPAATAVPELIAAIGDDKRLVRVEAINVLGTFGAQAMPAKSALLSGLGDKDKHVANAAANNIGKLGPEVLPDLVLACQDQEAKVRQWAIDAVALSPHVDADTIDAMRKLLKHESWETRFRAAVALDRKDEVARRAVPELIAALKDPDDTVRVNATNALRTIGTPEAVSALPKETG
ncbi:MAG: HEAT repeat domain-containing protein [Myxococcota bacterium]